MRYEREDGDWVEFSSAEDERGELLLADAERLAGLVKAKAELATLEEFEERLAALEAAR